MAVDNPIDFETFENAIITWFSGATGLTTVWAKQSTPQPPYPFATLDTISGPIAVAEDWAVTYSEVETMPDSGWGTSDWGTDPWGGEQPSIGIRKTWNALATVTIQCSVFTGSPNGRVAANAKNYMTKALGALETDTYRDTLNDLGIGVVRKMPMANDGPMAGNQRDSRSIADVQFNVGLSIYEDTTYIETVQLVSSSPIAIDEIVGVGG